MTPIERTAFFKVFGRVQGVGFRFFTARTARQLGIIGAARNCLDGSVEVIAHGSQEPLHQFEQALQAGPVVAKVLQVKRESATLSAINFDDFDIVF